MKNLNSETIRIESWKPPMPWGMMSKSALSGNDVGNRGHEQVDRWRKQWPGWKVGEKDALRSCHIQGEIPCGHFSIV